MSLLDHDYKTVTLQQDLQAARPLADEAYVPRGTTALYDAIGRTVNTLGLAALPEAERPSKVIIAILTDGLENASKEFSREQIFDIVRHQEEKYS